MRRLSIKNPPIMDFYGKESINTISSNLLFAGKEIKKIAFTSCVAGEGKSTMSLRVAINMAGRGKKTLLLDMDLRRSRLMQNAGIQAEDGQKVVGVAHYLAGHCSLDEVVYETDIENFYCIPIGRDVVNPLTMIDSVEFEELLEKMKEQFDLIIIDTPPIGLVVDAAEIAKHCNGIALVVEYGKRHKSELVNAVTQLKRSGCPILGCVIDKVIVKSLSEKQYYRSHYYYSNGKYGNYGSYGYGDTHPKEKGNESD